MSFWHSQFSRELIGSYSGSSRPILLASASIPVDVTGAHEQAHADLTANSSLGRYLMALSAATDQNELLRPVLERCMQSCWFVQEGYATIAQLEHCRLHHPDLAKIVWEKLPDSYQRAARQLEFTRSIWVGGKPPPSIGDARAVWEEAGRKLAAFIICKAAMSIPLAALLREVDALPSTRIAMAIRSQAPDVRLNRLLPHLAPELFGQVIAVTNEFNIDLEDAVGVNRIVSAIAQGVCVKAGLPFEHAEEILIEDVLQKFSPRTSINVFYSDKPGYADVVGPLTTTSRLVPSGSVSDFRKVVENLMLFSFQSRKPTLVAELEPVRDDGERWITLHVYYPCSLAQQAFGGVVDLFFGLMTSELTGNSDALFSALLSSVPPHWPCNVLSFRLRDEIELMTTGLSSQIPNAGIHWLVAEEAADNWDLKGLQKDASVNLCAIRGGHLPYKITGTWSVHGVHMANWTVGDVEEASRLGGRLGKEPHKGMSVSSCYELPSTVELVTYEPPGQPRGVELMQLRHKSSSQGDELARGASFAHNCLSEALLSGSNAIFLAHRMGLKMRNMNENGRT